MIEIRASSADRIMLCNYSSNSPEVTIDPKGKWSNFGDAGHAIMHKIVNDDLTSMPNLSGYVDEYEIEDEKALRISCNIGLKEYKNVIRDSIDHEKLISEARHKREIGGKYVLSGQTDIACLLNDPTVLFVGDWKFGEISNHFNQLKAYAFILLEKFPDVETVLLGQYFLRCNDKTVREFTREDIEVDWANKFVEALENDSLNPCWEACKYCPIIECDARDKLNNATMKALDTVNHKVSTAVALASKFEDVKLLEKQIAQYKQHLKDEILMGDEVIKLESGKVLSVIDGYKSTLYLGESMKILKRYFGDCSTDELLELLSSCITIKKTALMDIIGQHAGRGKKGEAKKQIEAAMERSGAIKVKTSKKLSLRKGDTK